MPTKTKSIHNKIYLSESLYQYKDTSATSFYLKDFRQNLLLVMKQSDIIIDKQNIIDIQDKKN